MKKAINNYGKLIHILESVDTEKYTCPVCDEVLTRRFGNIRQMFAHPKGKGEDCELKYQLILQKEQAEQDEEQTGILEKFYNKTFDDVKIEMSDYKMDDGYYATKEQKAIIFSEEEKIVVDALAGASKSTTLYYYAKENPDLDMLYIVYNRSMKDEADELFGKLDNVTVKTMHSLGYGYFGWKYKNKLTFNYGVIDIINDLGLNRYKDMQLASQINMFLNEFRLSEALTFDELKVEDLKNLKDDVKKEVVKHCKRLWELKVNEKNNVAVTHDFYLKLFQLSKKDLSRKYDVIMLDEAQDSSLLILDVLKSSKVEGIVVVGDPFQSLYKWRKSISIMDYIENATRYLLTTSFRVGNNIAELSNMLLADMTGSVVNMKGFNSDQKIVDTIDKSKKHAILCRTNSGIFQEAIENSDKKIFFVGGYQGYKFNDILDAYLFMTEGHTNNSKFSKFESYSKMTEYARETDDIEILSIDRVIEKYGSDIPRLVRNVCNNTVKNKDKADIILSTIHKSKGSTIKRPLLISSDHYDLNQIEHDKEEGKDIFEEACIVYVSITRAAGEIELSSILKEYLANKLGEQQA